LQRSFERRNETAGKEVIFAGFRIFFRLDMGLFKGSLRYIEKVSGSPVCQLVRALMRTGEPANGKTGKPFQSHFNSSSTAFKSFSLSMGLANVLPAPKF
jgi:hypothetical protein